VTVRIINADVMEGLAQLADESVHCVVTSPPYYGLRDYGVAGQIGLEPTLDEYLARMVAVFREVRRVLRSDGTLWLNIGDSYCAAPPGTKRPGASERSTLHGVMSETYRATLDAGSGKKMDTSRQPGMKPKDLMGVPWALAFALRADGWYLRSEIIWHKRSCMPESVTDRPTKSHEKIFLLAKSERYFYEAEAASEPVSEASVARVGQESWGEQEGSYRVPGKTNGTMKAVLKRSGNKERKPATERDCPRHGVAGSIPWEGSTRNWRDVWSLSPEPFKEAHFATFPTEIPRRAIVAGCPAGGTVLDPFGGSGTTGLVADRLQRDAILIELNPAYAAMARKRIAGDSPLFSEVA
jgi:DNA modification methylase